MKKNRIYKYKNSLIKTVSGVYRKQDEKVIDVMVMDAMTLDWIPTVVTIYIREEISYKEVLKGD